MHARFVQYDGFDPLAVLASHETPEAGGVEGPRHVPGGLRGATQRAAAAGVDATIRAFGPDAPWNAGTGAVAAGFTPAPGLGPRAAHAVDPVPAGA
ncbi:MULTISPECIES: hypothetical protein [unclassified Streptomyces]|uniref:hypothetical protein n=1 Tax=unclassified Streptomyces TaxID=2593676 RepID=UPI003811DD26